MAAQVQETRNGDATQLEEANKVIGVLETKLQNLENKLAQCHQKKHR